MTTDPNDAGVLAFGQYCLACFTDRVEVVEFHRVVIEVGGWPGLYQEVVMVALDPSERGDPFQNLIGNTKAKTFNEESCRFLELGRS